MKIFIKNSILTIFLSCCLLWSTSAESKVCFAGDGDCGGIETFGGYQDPTNDIASQCAKAGYDRTRSDCTPGKGEQVTDYCPYDSNYVKCCSLEYQYDSCVYPMVQTGKCGNKYKCVCDTAKYKYTANGSASDCKNNSYAGGASCAQVEYNKTSMTTSSSLHFTDCICDKGAYPMEESKCDKGAEFGEKCISINVNGGTETRYASCTCDTNKYPETVESCKAPSSDKYGVNTIDGHCVDGQIWHYKSCNHCRSDYPATSTAHALPTQCTLYTGKVLRSYKTINGVSTLVLSSDDGRYLEQINGKYYAKSSQSATCGYVKCPYSYDGQASSTFRYKHLNCEEGYEVKSGVCTIISCQKAVELLSAKVPAYELFTGSNKVSAATAIVAGNISVSANISCGSYTTTKCTSCSCATSSQSTQCLSADDMSKCPTTCVSYKPPAIDDGWNVDLPGIDDRPNTGPGQIIAPIPVAGYACCTAMSNVTQSMEGRGLACGTARKYISAKKFANSSAASEIASDLIAVLKEACTTTPTITVTGSSFPHSSAGTEGDMTFDDINLTLNGTTTVYRKLNLTSGNLTVTDATFKQDVTLNSNGMSGPKVKSYGTLTFEGAVNSSGYDYDFWRINIKNTNASNIGANFKGISSSKRIAVNGSYFSVMGKASFNNAYVRIPNAYIGYTSCYNGATNGSGLQNGSSVSLYNTVWYLYEGGTVRNVCMANACFLGALDNGQNVQLPVLVSGVLKQAYRIAHADYDYNCGEGATVRYINKSGGISTTKVHTCADCGTSRQNTGICQFDGLQGHTLTNYDNGSNTDYERNGCMFCRGGKGYRDGWFYDY